MVKVIVCFLVLWAIMLTIVTNGCNQDRPSYRHRNNALFLSAPDRGIEPMVLRPGEGHSSRFR